MDQITAFEFIYDCNHILFFIIGKQKCLSGHILELKQECVQGWWCNGCTYEYPRKEPIFLYVNENGLWTVDTNTYNTVDANTYNTSGWIYHPEKNPTPPVTGWKFPWMMKYDSRNVAEVTLVTVSEKDTDKGKGSGH